MLHAGEESDWGSTAVIAGEVAALRRGSPKSEERALGVGCLRNQRARPNLLIATPHELLLQKCMG